MARKIDYYRLFARVAILASMTITGLVIWWLFVFAGCYINWSDSNMDYRTKMFTCQVKHSEMGWVNEKRVRAVD